MPYKEFSKPYEVIEPALLTKDGHGKVVYWIDLITRDKVRVISEYRQEDGRIMRTKCWLGEDDSLSWEG